MNHEEHVNLLHDGVPHTGGVWADLGAGAGAFTLALAELIGAEGEIYAIDTNARALRDNERAMKAQFPAVKAHYQTADFTQPLTLPVLDGIVMANSLHFHRNKSAVLKLVHSYLRVGGTLLIVEYNTDAGNTWVPYPFTYPSWEGIAAQNGFAQTRLLRRRGSSFLNEMYSAASRKEA